MERLRSKQSTSLDQRLLEHVERLRKEASGTLPGALRNRLLRLARQAETGAQINEWLSSPGLRAPQ
jgi:hypothetical protein